MMTKDYLSKNLESLQKFRPELYARIAAHCRHSIGSFRLEGDDPRTALAASRELSRFEYPKIVICHGTGQGHALKDFLELRPRTVRHVVVVEKNMDLFIHSLKWHDFSELFAREDFEFLIAIPQDELPDWFLTYLLSREDRLICSDHVENYYFKPSLDRDGAYHVQVVQALKQAVKQISDKGQFAPGEDNWRGFINIVRNRSSLEKYPLISSFANFFAGRRALLIGAGPSLAAEMENIRRYRDKFFIMACDAAVVPLQKNGIDPDFMVTAERLARVAHLFEGLDPASRVVLFTLPSVHPQVLEQLHGPVVFLKRHASFGSWLWPDVSLPCVPLGVSSVGYAALRMMGFSEVYMLGQNLSLAQDSETTHVSGASDYLLSATKLLTEYDQVDTFSYTGAPLKTLRLWHRVIAEFEEMIRETPAVHCHHVIDPEKGTRVEGARQISPEAFWKEAKNFPEIGLERLAFAKKMATSRGINIDGRLLALKDYLEKLRDECLIFMDRISRDYQDSLDVMDLETMWRLLEDKLAEWRQWQDCLRKLDEWHYVNFICCLFSSTHVSLMAEREARVPRPESVNLYLMMHVFKTVEWAQKLLSWTGRGLYFLEKHGLDEKMTPLEKTGSDNPRSPQGMGDY